MPAGPKVVGFPQLLSRAAPLVNNIVDFSWEPAAGHPGHLRSCAPTEFRQDGMSPRSSPPAWTAAVLAAVLLVGTAAVAAAAAPAAAVAAVTTIETGQTDNVPFERLHDRRYVSLHSEACRSEEHAKPSVTGTSVTIVDE